MLIPPSIKMQFTMQTLSVLAASLLFSTVSAIPRCQPGDAWPDVRDCHNFFECAAGGIPVLKTCGPGTAYCPSTGVCDYEFKIPACHPHGPPPKGHGDEGYERPEGHADEEHEQPHGSGAEEHERPGAEEHEEPQGPAHGWPSASGYHGHGAKAMGPKC
ncbi:hypothetical protein CNMCM5793_005102 [Aspergillus hiratsukae]|uniref:Chitin-binding type-2 domain-containing protein n=1 Tax=Aspergillus hiratsukae TaxID=1194566 RepID=A0A8H6UGC1_9EURO|nr:hypothetical protein CNMCM5793_005102 [Aspergillus hiratsukae]